MAWPKYAALKHGNAKRGGKTPEYNVWCSMRARCANVNDMNYGGRGITVCERWQVFENFLADVGERPSSAHTIERKDNDKGYSPDNCVWATRDIQARNRRPRRAKQFCPRNHPLSGDNLYLAPRGRRRCKTCYRDYLREWNRARSRERKAA